MNCSRLHTWSVGVARLLAALLGWSGCTEAGADRAVSASPALASGTAGQAVDVCTAWHTAARLAHASSTMAASTQSLNSGACRPKH
jgi:hypothetical protein